jgi:hypothetical protein
VSDESAADHIRLMTWSTVVLPCDLPPRLDWMYAPNEGSLKGATRQKGSDGCHRQEIEETGGWLVQPKREPKPIPVRRPGQARPVQSTGVSTPTQMRPFGDYSPKRSSRRKQPRPRMEYELIPMIALCSTPICGTVIHHSSEFVLADKTNSVP